MTLIFINKVQINIKMHFDCVYVFLFLVKL